MGPTCVDFFADEIAQMTNGRVLGGGGRKLETFEGAAPQYGFS
jgi:hypothetical protein